jgi:hypothetical protein
MVDNSMVSDADDEEPGSKPVLITSFFSPGLQRRIEF